MAGEALGSPVRRVGRYALYREIASGGMATVFVGRQQGQAGFARTVAIKRLHPQFAKEPDFVAMFLDEARLAARIRHPNVVPTLDVVSTEGELFLVMEFVQGESLSRLMRASRQRKENPPTRVVAAIMADVLHGLHAAHEATSEKGEPLGLVHRDVSPHNVLVGADGVSRVVDFGVAKAAGRIQTTREGQIKGKIAYMAPEQITGVVSRRSDVYAASVVLWEVVTGKRLFAGENEAVVLNQVLNAKVTPPSQLVEGLDPAWDEIVMKGLEREEPKRWETAREMAVAIETRLQLARATQVAEWVELLAGDSLAKRAADVTSIESASDIEVVPALQQDSGVSAPVVEPPAAAPAQPPPSAVAAESTASRIGAVSRPLDLVPLEPRRPSRAVIAGGVVAVVGMVLLAWFVGTRHSVQPLEAPASSAVAVEAPPPPAPSVDPSVVPAVSSAPPAPVQSASAVSSAAAPHTHRPTRPRPVSSVPSLGDVLDTRH
ncbi:MAG TPA: serine/threonine-protein kinase [Polyangiaceae bacterium]|nr:serine/threonine-protein kinase [Polyangiaceae bacterium]